jgi:predicted NAD/FAD-dependent oxidoreductase
MEKKYKIYDYLIAGAGISGLYTAYRITQKEPTAKICILEASTYIGGRLHTIKYDGLTFDGGGARFNTEQIRIMSLVKELNLDKKMIPITNEINYKPYKPKYNINLETTFPTIDDFIKELKQYIKDNNISRQQLINTTIYNFTKQHLENQYPTLADYIISIYPYYSELAILNAEEAIILFSNEFSAKVQYYVLNGGLQQLADSIYNKLKHNKNITIHIETPLDIITKLPEKIYKIKSNIAEKTFYTKKIILAITQPKLLNIKYISRHTNIKNNLNSIQCEPLYRIYARYPVDPQTNKVWFHQMGKMSSNLPIKYIIPVDENKGLIMISYTDSKYADFWIEQMANNQFETELNKQLQLLFPDLKIPKPKWYKHCPWTVGAGYWKPHFDRKIIMPKIIKPLKNDDIFICGENYSTHQAWVEGALETSNMVLDKLLTKKSTKKSTKKNPMVGGKINEYTLEEVAKHNTKKDAWITINGIVADITKWIPNHPGGDIIMRGVGKDATNLFKQIGHSNNARKMLKKYQIGILKK